MTEDIYPTWATRLIDLLEEQKRLYDHLHELAEQQMRFVRDDAVDPATLVLLLGRRQSLIDQLGRLNDRIDPYRRNWSKLWGGLTPAWRCRLRGQVDQVRRAVDRLIVRDAMSGRRIEPAMPHPLRMHRNQGSASEQTS